MERDAMQLCSDSRKDSDNLHSQLSNAIVSNDERSLELLLKSGADVNVSDELGNTALHIAAKLGHPRLCQLLIQHGAGVNSKNHACTTPLLFASRTNPQTVQVLIQHGADVACRNHVGELPLHTASSSGLVDVIVELVTSGSDVNLASWQGLTPLCVAVNSGSANAVKTLLRFGADPKQVLLVPELSGGENISSCAGCKEKEEELVDEGRQYVRVCVPGEEGLPHQRGHGASQSQELAVRRLRAQSDQQPAGVRVSPHRGGRGLPPPYPHPTHHLGPLVQPPGPQLSRRGPTSYPRPLCPPPTLLFPFHVQLRLWDLSAQGPRPCPGPVPTQPGCGLQRGLDCVTVAVSPCPPLNLSSPACVCPPVSSTPSPPSPSSPNSAISAGACCSRKNKPGKFNVPNASMFCGDIESSQLESNTQPSLSPSPNPNSKPFPEESAQCQACATDDNMEPTLPDLTLGGGKNYKLREATSDGFSPVCDTLGPSHCVEDMELDTVPLLSFNRGFSGQSVSENNTDIQEEFRGCELLFTSHSENPTTVEEDSEEVQNCGSTFLAYRYDAATPMEVTDTGLLESSGTSQSDTQRSSLDSQTTRAGRFTVTDTASSSLLGSSGTNSFLGTQKAPEPSAFAAPAARSSPPTSTEKAERESPELHKIPEKHFRGVTFRQVPEDAHEQFMDTEPVSFVASLENTEKIRMAFTAETDKAKDSENTVECGVTSISMVETISMGHCAKEMELGELPRMCSNDSVSNRDAVISSHRNTNISTSSFAASSGIFQEFERTTTPAAKSNPALEAENVEAHDFEKTTTSATKSSLLSLTDNRVPQDPEKATASAAKPNPLLEAENVVAQDFEKNTPSATKSSALFVTESFVARRKTIARGAKSNPLLAAKNTVSTDLGMNIQTAATSTSPEHLVGPSDTQNPCPSQQKGFTSLHQCTTPAENTSTPEHLERPSDAPNSCASQQKGFTALHRAAQLGMETVCQTLLELGAKVNGRTTRDETPLHLAAKFANTGGRGDVGGLVRLLVRAGADVDAVTSSGETALHLAAWVGDALFASVLLSEGADARRTDAAGNTPLHKACQRMVSPEAQRVRTVRVLLSSGAKADAVNRHGLTPLHELLLHRDDRLDLDVVRVLVSYGADPNRLTAAGEHPLMQAVRCGLFAFATVLVEHGANPRVVSEGDGKTPMHYACQAAQVPLFRLLWTKGGDPTQLDARGFSPLRCAVESGSEAMVRACLDTGASTFQPWESDLPKLPLDSKAIPSLSELLASSSDSPSPFLCAFLQAHAAILAMLYASGCYSSAELHHLRAICELVNPDELPEREKDAVLFLLDISQSPPSLQNLCRWKISHMIGCTADRKLCVCSLRLPTTLRNFVLFADDFRNV